MGTTSWVARPEVVGGAVLLLLALAAERAASARTDLKLPPAFSHVEGLPEASVGDQRTPVEDVGHTGLGSFEPADSAG